MSELLDRCKASVVDVTGARHEVTVGLADYKAASEQQMSLRTYLSEKIPTADGTADAFTQVLASNGIRLRYDPVSGAAPSKMSKFTGLETGMSISRPDGSNALTIAGRLLLPSIVEQIILSELMTDNSSYEGEYNQMVAVTTPVESNKIFQPIINVQGPANSNPQPIASGAEPVNMMRISLSDRNLSVPRFAIGLEIDDEAARAMSIDVVGIQIREQAREYRTRLLDTGLAAMISGDTDAGLAALTGEAAAVYDSNAVSAATFSNKAWVKWLYKDRNKMSANWVICDIDAYLAIQDRTGRPVVTGDMGNDNRLTVNPYIQNPGLPADIRFFIVESSVVGAGTMVGIDSRKAIQKYIWTAGAYAATEAYVMRRTTAMRFDMAELSTRLLPKGQGWKKLTFA